MQDALKRFLLVCLTVFAVTQYSDAQPRSIGTSYSISGIGLEYEHDLNRDCFINADIRAEMLAFFMNRNDSPGISASFSCNFTLKEWNSRNDNAIRIFAGPGVTAGLTHEFRKDNGIFFGLKGRVGAECRFDRNVAVSICLNPILGSHLTIVDEHIEMRYYKAGLINAILPEIGIRYTF